jgi:hypothetical protein
VENKVPESPASEAAQAVEPAAIESVPVVPEVAAVAEAPVEVPVILPTAGLEPVSADFAGPAPQSVESQPVFDHSLPETTEPVAIEPVATTETPVVEPVVAAITEPAPILVYDEPLVQLAELTAPEVPSESVTATEQADTELQAEPVAAAEVAPTGESTAPVEPEAAVAETTDVQEELSAEPVITTEQAEAERPIEPVTTAEIIPEVEPTAPVEPEPVVADSNVAQEVPPAVPSMAPALAAILAGTLPEPVPTAVAALELPESQPEPVAVVESEPEPAVQAEPVVAEAALPEVAAEEVTPEPAPVAEAPSEVVELAPVVEPEASAPVAEAFAAAETASASAPLVFVAAPAPKPEGEAAAEPVVATQSVTAPFVVPALGLSDRLNAFALWACERLNTQEVLLIDDYGDVLWGARATSPLVLSTMAVWQSAQRTAAESAGNELHRIDKDLEDGTALTVLSVRTRYGVVSCSAVLPSAMSEADEEALRTGLIPAVEGV